MIKINVCDVLILQIIILMHSSSPPPCVYLQELFMRIGYAKHYRACTTRAWHLAIAA